MTKEHPIIFSTSMIQALLAGRKTQTRRLSSHPLQRVLLGDQLWVRETFIHGYEYGPDDMPIEKDGEMLEKTWYRATTPDLRWDNHQNTPWKPSIHMPRWASRITLTVTDVRFQRLQDIHREDALAEGCQGGCGPEYDIACHAYQLLWESLYGARSWEANPEVVAITFDVEKKS